MDDVDRTFSDDISRRPKVRVHTVGPLRGSVQRCTKCGLILSDYRISIAIKGSRKISGFAEGATVAVMGGGRWVTGKKLAKDEVPCDLFERN